MITKLYIPPLLKFFTDQPRNRSSILRYKLYRTHHIVLHRCCLHLIGPVFQRNFKIIAKTMPI